MSAALHTVPMLEDPEIRSLPAAPQPAPVEVPDMSPSARRMAYLAIALGFAWLAVTAAWLYLGALSYQNFR